MTTNEKKRKWLDDGLLKVEHLDFLTADAGRTLGQAALQFILAEPSVISVLPNIYDAPQLEELVRATDTRPLGEDELRKVMDLYSTNFHLDPADVDRTATIA